MPPEAKEAAAAETTPAPRDGQLDSIRAILLAPTEARLDQLEARAAELAGQSQQDRADLQAELAALQHELATVTRQAARLQQELAELRARLQAETEALEPRLRQRLAGLMSQAIRNARDEMAEALGPVMGDAIRVQIRESRQGMVEALYPIILETVQRALAEFARELQQNIDRRLQATFGSQGWLRRLSARLRGVSPAELALRDALPYALDELFVIQHGSGLLLAHADLSGKEDLDSDLIGGMLTAIRDFAHDSFSSGAEDSELDEIQFGDQQIVVQSGQHVYAAVVLTGVAPAGLRAAMRRFVAELHIQWGPQLRDYDGRRDSIPDLAPLLAAFVDGLTGAAPPPPMSRSQRLALAGGGLAAALLVATACFYLQFTLALLPVAFGRTPTPSPTATLLAVPPPTATLAPPTATPAPPTATPAPPTASPAPPTATPDRPRTIAPAWLFVAPDVDAAVAGAIPASTAVTIVSRDGAWVEVQWTRDPQPPLQGWLPARWLATPGG